MSKIEHSYTDEITYVCDRCGLQDTDMSFFVRYCGQDICGDCMQEIEGEEE